MPNLDTSIQLAGTEGQDEGQQEVSIEISPLTFWNACSRTERLSLFLRGFSDKEFLADVSDGSLEELFAHIEERCAENEKERVSTLRRKLRGSRAYPSGDLLRVLRSTQALKPEEIALFPRDVINKLIDALTGAYKPLEVIPEDLSKILKDMQAGELSEQALETIQAYIN